MLLKCYSAIDIFWKIFQLVLGQKKKKHFYIEEKNINWWWILESTFLFKKKRNLSDNSKKDTDPKEDKEATWSSSYSNPDVFEEG